MKIMHSFALSMFCLGVMSSYIEAITRSEAQYERKLRAEAKKEQKERRIHAQELKKIDTLEKQISQVQAQAKAALAGQKRAQDRKDEIEALRYLEKGRRLEQKAEKLQTKLDGLIKTREEFIVPKKASKK